MTNMLELLQKENPKLKGLTKRKIEKTRGRHVDPVQAARSVVLTRIKENIAGLKALANGSEWPSHAPAKPGDKAVAYAKWFEHNSSNNTCEAVHSLRKQLPSYLPSSTRKRGFRVPAPTVVDVSLLLP